LLVIIVYLQESQGDLLVGCLSRHCVACHVCHNTELLCLFMPGMDCIPCLSQHWIIVSIHARHGLHSSYITGPGVWCP